MMFNRLIKLIATTYKKNAPMINANAHTHTYTLQTQRNQVKINNHVAAAVAAHLPTRTCKHTILKEYGLCEAKNNLDWHCKRKLEGKELFVKY